jgi:two-component system C4-dicarboxylate transport sensor histidine kinase DctB
LCEIPHSTIDPARRGRESRPDRRVVSFVLLAIVAASLCSALTGHIMGNAALTDLTRSAEFATRLRVAALRSELEKYRSLPSLLAADPELRALLSAPTSTRVDALNHRLGELAVQTRAAAIYVLDRNGTTIVASNWNSPSGFLGQSYSFRAYFQEAMRVGASEVFALGTVSRRPGLYIARRVGDSTAALGVVVTKIEFDALEAEWATSDDLALVADSAGIIQITTVKEWRFRALDSLPIVMVDRSIPGRFRSFVARVTSPATATDAPAFLATDAATALLGWRMHLLTPTSRLLNEAEAMGRIIGGLLATVAVMGAAALAARIRRARAKAAQGQDAQRELESHVAERTRELELTNARLVIEIDERRRAESGLQTLQHELVQATKLAVLGQITAGVAHEINQPLAAIRAYVDNAARYLEALEFEQLGANLTAISQLTERIGLITGELRAFSRKSAGKAVPMPLEAAISGALLLTASRVRARDVRLVREGQRADCIVYADRTRLEQVLVNLLQNALEAMERTVDPEIRICVATGPHRVTITIADNGPGIDPRVASELFTPFRTTKPQGLGLGLVISRDIVAEFGGELVAVTPRPRGTAFTMTLRRAR